MKKSRFIMLALLSLSIGFNGDSVNSQPDNSGNICPPTITNDYVRGWWATIDYYRNHNARSTARSMYYKANRYNAFNSALDSEDINVVVFIQYNIAQIMDSLHARRVQTDSSGNKKANFDITRGETIAAWNSFIETYQQIPIRERVSVCPLTPRKDKLKEAKGRIRSLTSESLH